MENTIKSIVNSNTPQYTIHEIRLFGSRAREDYSERSDYDILVVLKEDITAGDKMVLMSKIQKECADHLLDVDVIIKSVREVDYYKDKIGNVVHEAMREGVTI